MKKLLYILLLLFSFCTLIFGQQPNDLLKADLIEGIQRVFDPSFTPERDALSKIEPYFYCISGNGIKPGNEIYVLGICHYLSKEGYPEYIHELLNSAGQLFCESTFESIEKWNPVAINIEDIKEVFGKLNSGGDFQSRDSAFKKKKSNNRNNKEWAPWYELTTSEEKKILNKYFEDDQDYFYSYSDHLMGKIMSELLGLTFDDLIDFFILNNFKEARKSVTALDTPYMDEMADIIDQMERAYADQNADLDRNLILTLIKAFHFKVSEEEVRMGRMIEICKIVLNRLPRASDIDSILQYKDDVIDISLDWRNLEWRKNFKEALKSGQSTAIVVGAYHLLGEVGVLNFFVQKGYTITHIGNPEAARPYLEELSLRNDDVVARNTNWWKWWYHSEL